MSESGKSRGGSRTGAGRPKGDSRMYSFRCPGSLAAELDRLGNRTDFIRKSLERALSAGQTAPLRIPFFDFSVVAGFPVPLDNDERSQDIELLSLLCPHPESSYLVRVKGDSMIDAGILDGDIVIVDKSNRAPSRHEIAVCELNGEYTLKFYLEDKEGRWLVPANPDYPRFRINDGDTFSIWGTVTYIIHRARV